MGTERLGTERRQALLLLALPPVVALAGGSPVAALAALGEPSADALGAGPLIGAVALLAWALTGWLTVVLAIGLAERLPGVFGRAAARCLTRVAPTSVRSMVRAATGLAVAGTVLLSGATAHADPARSHPSAAPGPAVTQNLDWPTSPTATSTPTPSAAIAQPTAAPTASEPPRQHAPAPAARAADRQAVVVQPGDCLWHVAAEALGPDATDRQIATTWPTWWSANRAAIGDDPNLLRPGTTLLPPQHP